MDDNDTYEVKLSDGETYTITGDSYHALQTATMMTGQHTRYVKVIQRTAGHGSDAGAEMFVNCDHVVTAVRLG
jgi:hypothetical protein